ncbi:MAG TPA: PEP-CTERM sorting domain-containing protein [Vicinamibacterales bacterium]|nr:PEP-CTERM sorting domain-containing protein [Vicinamibacterales bacterium]
MTKSGIALACVLLAAPAAAPVAEADYIRFNLYGHVTFISQGIFTEEPFPPPAWNISVGTPWRGLLSIDLDQLGSYGPHHSISVEVGAFPRPQITVGGFGVSLDPVGRTLAGGGDFVLGEWGRDSQFMFRVPLPPGVSLTAPPVELLRSIDAFTAVDDGYFSYRMGVPSGFSGASFSGPITGMEPVPEPASLLLLGSGLVGLAGRAWRKRQRTHR